MPSPYLHRLRSRGSRGWSADTGLATSSKGAPHACEGTTPSKQHAGGAQGTKRGPQAEECLLATTSGDVAEKTPTGQGDLLLSVPADMGTTMRATDCQPTRARTVMIGHPRRHGLVRVASRLYQLASPSSSRRT